MNKRTLILIILILIILAGGFFFLFLRGSNGGQTEDGEDSGFLGLFPQGQEDDQGGVVGDRDGNDKQDLSNQDVGDRPIPRLRKVSQGRSPGYGIFIDDSGSSTVRFLEKETGHIYEATPDTNEVRRISNTTIPGIEEVFWLGPDSLVLRYVDEENQIQSFLTSLSENEGEEFLEIESEALHSGILRMATIEENIFAVSETGEGSVLWETINQDLERTSLAENPLKRWRVQPLNENRVALQTAPSRESVGSLYILNVGSVTLTPLLEGIRGLTANVSPSGEKVFYSTSAGSNTTNLILDRENSRSFIVPTNTLADKCTWTPDEKFLYCGAPQNGGEGNLPDAWYQGLVSFNDVIYKINTSNGGVEVVYNPQEENGVSLDMYKMEVGPNGDYLYFLNRKGGGFWIYKI